MMGFEDQRRYRSDDRDLPDGDRELVLSMGGNGDWYFMIVETGRKLGPSVRVTTSGAPRELHLVAGAVANLYRALRGEKPPHPLELYDNSPPVSVFEVQRLHEAAQSPALAAENAQLRARVKELEQALEDAGYATRDAEVEMARAQENEERWRRDAVEDKPAREVLKEVREVLGVVEGEGVMEVAKRMMGLLAESKDVHVNLRPWITRAEKLMSSK